MVRMETMGISEIMGITETSEVVSMQDIQM